MFLVPHKKVMAFKPTRQILWDPYTFGVYLLLNTLGVVNFSKRGCGPLSSCLQTTVV